MSNYPAGVTDADDHFTDTNLPDDEVEAHRLLCGCTEWSDGEIDLCPDHVATVPCNADGSPCTAANGSPCPACQANHDYWRRQWERVGRREVAGRYSADDVRDAYSEPCETAKRERLLRELDDHD